MEIFAGLDFLVTGSEPKGVCFQRPANDTLHPANCALQPATITPNFAPRTPAPFKIAKYESDQSSYHNQSHDMRI